MQICKTRAFNHNSITYKHNYSENNNVYYHRFVRGKKTCPRFPDTANAILTGSDFYRALNLDTHK